MAQFDDDNDFLKFAGLAVIAIGALMLPGAVTTMLGLEGFWRWLWTMPVIIRYPFMAVIWGLSWIVAAGIGKGLLAFAETALTLGSNATDRIAAAVSRGLTAALEYGAAGAWHLTALAIWPARMLIEYALDVISPQLLLLRQKWEEARELRRLYREEFRTEFRSFREFRQHFENAGAGQDRRDEKPRQEEAKAKEAPKPREDPFAAACRLLGLPESGAFSAADLKARYRTLMKSLHPDVAGPNELATQVNAACSLIRKRKGWS